MYVVLAILDGLKRPRCAILAESKDEAVIKGLRVGLTLGLVDDKDVEFQETFMGELNNLGVAAAPLENEVQGYVAIARALR